VRTMLARGAFGEASVEAVGAALRMFAPGLLTYTIAELAARAFYARHDFLRPLAAAAIGTAAYLGMAPLFAHALGPSGPALANSLAIGLEGLLLLRGLRRMRMAPPFPASYAADPSGDPLRGISRTASTPRGARGCRRRRPPWASATLRATASPMPIPPNRRVVPPST
jgi:hypothetical protein